MKKWIGRGILCLALLLAVLALPATARAAEDDSTQITVRVHSGHGTVKLNNRTPTAASDSVYVEKGTAMTVTAFPDAGYHLSYWSVPGGQHRGVPGSASYSFNANYDGTYNAVFAKDATTGSVTIADIDLGVESVGYVPYQGDMYRTYLVKGDVVVANGTDATLALGAACVTLDAQGSQYFAVGSSTGYSSGRDLQAGTTWNSSCCVVYPKPGLAAGTYRGTVTLQEVAQSAISTPVTAKVTFTVTNDPVITTAASPAAGGTVTGGGRYEKGQNVTLTATPNEHYQFVRWSDGATANPYTFKAAESATVNAVFEKYEFGTTVAVNGGHGKVKLNDRTPTDASDTVYAAKGTSMTVTAIPDEGYHLSYWSVPGGQHRGVPGSASYSFTANYDGTYNAVFAKDATTGSVTIADVDLGVESVGYVPYQIGAGYYTYLVKGDVVVANGTDATLALGAACVTLDAQGSQYFAVGSSTGYSSGRDLQAGTTWDSSCCVVYPKPGLAAGTYTGTVTLQEVAQSALSAPVTAKVTFTVTTKYKIVTEASPAGAGTVTGAGEYTSGKNVTLTATPADPDTYRFSHWERAGGTSTANPYTFKASQAETVTAVFERIAYRATVAADPAEAGSVRFDGKSGTSLALVKGSAVSVTATANKGWRFTHWTDNGAQVGNSSTVSVTAIVDHELVAHFEKAPTVTKATSSDGKTVNYTLSLPDNGKTLRVCAAWYGQNGQLLGVKSAEVRCEGTVNGSLTGDEAATKGAASWKLFLLDESFAPVCESRSG